MYVQLFTNCKASTYYRKKNNNNNKKKNCKSFVVVMYYKGELNEFNNFSINLQSKREFSQCQLENSFGHLYY